MGDFAPTGIHRTKSEAAYVYGLDWTVAGDNEREWPTLDQSHPPFLRMRMCKAVPLAPARVEAAEVLESDSLLLAMAAALAAKVDESSGPWLFIAEISRQDGADQSVFLFALADMFPNSDGEASTGERHRMMPRPEPERTTDSIENAVTVLNECLSVIEVSGIAVWWSPDVEDPRFGQILEVLSEGKARNIQLRTLDLETRPVAKPNLPTFRQPRIIPVRKILLGTMALAVLAGAVFAVLAALEALRPAPPPPPARIDVIADPNEFFSACTAAMSAWWPRAIGWTERTSGCVMDSEWFPDGISLPPAPSPAHRQMVAWHEYVPTPGMNPVLLETITAGMTQAWPHEKDVSPTRLLLWRTDISSVIAASDGPISTIGEMRQVLMRKWPTGIERIGEADFTLGKLHIDMENIDLEDVRGHVLSVPGLMPVTLNRFGADSREDDVLTLRRATREDVLLTDFTQARAPYKEANP